MLEQTTRRAFRVVVVAESPEERAALRDEAAGVEERPEVLVAASVDDVERLLKLEPISFDVALIADPGGEGAREPRLADVVRKIVERHPLTKVVVCTRGPSVEGACEAYEAGASAYVPLVGAAAGGLRRKVSALLARVENWDDIARQIEAQRIADEEFEAHRDEWVKRYARKLVLFDAREKTILAANANPRKIAAKIDMYDRDAKLDITIVYVPSERE